MIPLSAILYLGEGHTPLIKANPALTREIGLNFYYKNDGQNPSASFKDRAWPAPLNAGFSLSTKKR